MNYSMYSRFSNQNKKEYKQIYTDKMKWITVKGNEWIEHEPSRVMEL